MACREVEMGKKKCERYWPLQVGEAMDIGAIKVTMVSLWSAGRAAPPLLIMNLPTDNEFLGGFRL